LAIVRNANVNIVELLRKNGWTPRKPAPEDEIRRLKETFQIDLPEDYEQVLLASNGCSLYGFQTPLVIYSITEVLALFREHDLYENIPHSLIFGGDGAGTIYCYDLRAKNDQGSYDVFFVKEDEAYYEKIFFRSPSLTDIVIRITNNENINLDIS
jgi:hypothetical protein